MTILWYIFPLFAAFLWRIRGGLLNSITGKVNWLDLNDTAVRFIWSVGISIYYGLLSHYTLVDLGLIVALFAGTTLVGWFKASLYPTKWSDIGLLSLSGSLRMAFVSTVLLSPWPLVVGLLCGPIYWISGKIPQPRPWMFWQEWAFGFAIGVSLILSILYPMPLHWNQIL